MNRDASSSLRDSYSARTVFATERAPAILLAVLDGPLHYTEILASARSFHASDGSTQLHFDCTRASRRAASPGPARWQFRLGNQASGTHSGSAAKTPLAKL